MINRISNKLKRLARTYRSRILAEGKTKYFCIGRNKTGTTSIAKAFEDLGFSVGNQREAELLADEHGFDHNFKPIIDYCRSAQVFQDVPFSWSETFNHLDLAYPGSKFILTVRDDPEQWYRSITQFHAKMFGHGQTPSADDLREAQYIRKGFMYRAVKQYGAPDDDIYNKDILIGHYNRHNQAVLDYFCGRPEDLLVINLAEKNSYIKFVEFIGVESPWVDFPWENKT
jgi:hypothetical protein